MTAVATAPRTGTQGHGAEAGMLWRQTRHELVSLVRTPITLILSIGLPLLFFVLLSALVGNQVVDETQGVRLVQFLAPGMASFGVVMATFSFLAVGLAEARVARGRSSASRAPPPRAGCSSAGGWARPSCSGSPPPPWCSRPEWPSTTSSCRAGRLPRSS